MTPRRAASKTLPMSTASLTIDLDALVANWRALDAKSATETGAVVKAAGYGLGAPIVARRLAKAGARQFFVAVAEEGAAVRMALGRGPTINVMSGHMAGDTELIREHDLTPMINSVDQMLRHVEALAAYPFGVQLDTGMNRLGMEPVEWSALRDIALAQKPTLLMSHLACSDTRSDPMNPKQLSSFRDMTDGIDVPKSLAATGGILLGPDYHFDLTRPGVGLYGGHPFKEAASVVTLSLPVIQIRDVEVGETVGYAKGWTAKRMSRIATVSGGYADGLIRAMGNRTALWAGDQKCPLVGRVSMDLVTVDVTDVAYDPETLDILGRNQSVDDVATAAGTIGYEILTSLGHRYKRTYLG